MKRSEALEIIKEYLDINGGHLVPEQILAIVEKIGMFPPANKLTESGKLQGYDHEYLYWESENEN
jgi:hypothetical protein